MSEDLENEVANEEDTEVIFDLTPSEYKFKIRDKDGAVFEYTLRELLGTEREAYLNSIKDKFEITASGKSKVKNFTGIQTGLLKLCVYDQDDALVPEKVLAKWPAGLQSKLYKKANKMSGMDEAASDEAKND